MPRPPYTPIFILSLGIAAGAGCKVKVKPDFNSSFPQDRFAAIVQARQTQDQTAVKPLIGQLASDDPLVRLAAADTLRSITGENHGYDHAASRDERRAGIKRWADWYESTTGERPTIAEHSP
ncbi:MAG: HEAT repeat domain-containing protein [Phycisphaerales bacterium JB061]